MSIFLEMEKTLSEIMGTGGVNASQGSVSNSTKHVDEKTIPFEDSEISVMLEFLEANYKALYGHRSGTEYKANKDRKWKEFVATVNKVYK